MGRDPSCQMVWITDVNYMDPSLSSKPAGRRLVTADLNLLLNVTLHLAVLTFSLGLLTRTVAGPVSFWLVFLLVEVLMKISFLMVAAVANVCGVIQFTILYHPAWILDQDDKVKFRKFSFPY